MAIAQTLDVPASELVKEAELLPEEDKALGRKRTRQ
jgi:hypothetical protein